MTRHLRFVLGDQLPRDIGALRDIAPQDVVMMVEVASEARHVPHHKQKTAFLLSAMRHFVDRLRAEGIRVDHVKLDDPANTHRFTGELVNAVARHAPAPVVVTKPGEWRVWQMMQAWDVGCPLDLRDDDRFFRASGDFAALTKARKTDRMDYFYREMRRRTELLMQGDVPEGGQWNFDPENRKAMPRGLRLPSRRRFAPDTITRDVLALVAARFGTHFGDPEPFGWAETREGALQALDHFITDCLPTRGDHQHKIKPGKDLPHHILILPYLNFGLLTAHEVCDRAEVAHQTGDAPIKAVEGFIRQIRGWREFVRGIYWAEMPYYALSNHLNATPDLPALYWTGDAPMRRLVECIGTTRRHANARHIQRLMVTGIFALPAGVAPAQIEEWYLAVYADAFERVDLPNVHGMVMRADGGRLASKPHAASGAYIERMSDCCKTCAYDPKVKLGPKARPFSYLYWNFLIENAATLQPNPRMSLPHVTLSKMPAEQQADIVHSAAHFLAGLQTPLTEAQLDLPW